MLTGVIDPIIQAAVGPWIIIRHCDLHVQWPIIAACTQKTVFSLDSIGTCWGPGAVCQSVDLWIMHRSESYKYAATYSDALIAPVFSALRAVRSHVALRNVCWVVQLQTVDIADTDRLSGQLCVSGRQTLRMIYDSTCDVSTTVATFIVHILRQPF